jgi:hypothetical protein
MDNRHTDCITTDSTAKLRAIAQDMKGSQQEFAISIENAMIVYTTEVNCHPFVPTS